MVHQGRDFASAKRLQKAHDLIQNPPQLQAFADAAYDLSGKLIALDTDHLLKLKATSVKQPRVKKKTVEDKSVKAQGSVTVREIEVGHITNDDYFNPLLTAMNGFSVGITTLPSKGGGTVSSVKSCFPRLAKYINRISVNPGIPVPHIHSRSQKNKGLIHI